MSESTNKKPYMYNNVIIKAHQYSVHKIFLKMLENESDKAMVPKNYLQTKP